MELRFVSWNIHGKRQREKQIGLLEAVSGDLVALQLVTVAGYHDLVESSLFAWSAFSLDLRPPFVYEGRGHQLGCAIFGQLPFRLRKYYLLELLPFPERALVAEVDSPAGPLTLCSFHTPNGSRWKELKPQSLTILAQWLVSHSDRTLVGIDANTPKADYPDIAQNQWWWDDEPQMLGSRPLHSLHDALRVWLAAHPIEAEQMYSLRPQGPLAISYYRGKKKRPVLCRYDFIYVTPDFTVSNVNYFYREAIEVGSDHALVVADLRHISSAAAITGYDDENLDHQQAQ